MKRNIRLTVACLVLPLCVVAADLFVDVTDSSGLDFEHFNGMSGALYFPEMKGSGVALLDYDRDGDTDVYLLQGHMLGSEQLGDTLFEPRHAMALTDRLYRNDTQAGALKFTDLTEKSGLSAQGYSMGVVAADYDNNGWLVILAVNEAVKKIQALVDKNHWIGMRLLPLEGKRDAYGARVALETSKGRQL